MYFCWLILVVCRLEDFEGEEIDEEALIEQRRQQRMAIVQVCSLTTHLLMKRKEFSCRSPSIQTFLTAFIVAQKYKVLNEDTNLVSEPSSPQSSTRSRSPSPDDILERVAADVKEYERENVNTFEASIKAKHNLIAQEKDGNVLVKRSSSVGVQGQLNEPHHCMLLPCSLLVVTCLQAV